MTGPADSHPRQAARTRNFTLGAPRTFRVSSDGTRVVFLRSASGDDPVNGLWVLDLDSGAERMVAGGGEPEVLPDAERARRERVRETGGGIVAYDADPACTAAVVTATVGLALVDLAGDGGVEPLAALPGASDPRLAPAAGLVSYVCDRALRLVDPTGRDRLLAGEEAPDISWGSAEFVAAEEMGRTRGHWWAPDGRRVVAARVDTGRVARWHVWDPTEPAGAPAHMRYPAAGTPNADVGLAIVDLDGGRVPVAWDRERLPYVVAVHWGEAGLLVAVQARDQRVLEVLAVDAATGATTRRVRLADPAWVDVVAGTPAWVGSRVLTAAGRLALDGEPVTPEGLHVRRVCHVDAGRGQVLFTASGDDPTVVDVYLADTSGRVERVTPGGGVHDLLAAGPGVAVVSSRSAEHDGAVVRVLRDGEEVCTVASYAERPLARPVVSFGIVGGRRLRTALLVPQAAPVDGPLPVLMDPYGGPHHQRVQRNRSAFLTSQWLADQGFAVVVADGRGTPGRGGEWDRAVRGDLAGPVLDDQVDALHALAAADDRLDLDRVAIRGWSFGGYLAALAVLRRPDVFHAAVAGAPVTDWTLYDTHYTERYLGHPAADPAAYARSSIVADAARLERPLLLIHGLLDDNVVAAHTLRLSAALVAAGRPHGFLPLPGATHLTRDEAVAENLLRLQVAFLQEALGPASRG